MKSILSGKIVQIGLSAPPGPAGIVRLPRTVEKGKEFFYANDFLNEPEIYRPDTRTPY